MPVVQRNWMETTGARGGDIYIVNSVTSLGIGLQTFAISRVCEGSRAQRFTTCSLMEADDKAAPRNKSANPSG